MKIGIVTVTYNSANVLPDFLDSVFATSGCDYHLFVIDNASTDSTIKILENRVDPRISVTKNTINRGVAGGNNQGIQQALKQNCSHVLLINNDVKFDSKLIPGLAAGIKSSGADAFVPLILFWGSPCRVWFGGGRFVVPLPYPTMHAYYNQNKDIVPKSLTEIEYSPTCCMLINADVFKRIGLMDESYFVYCDDTDFCMRMNRAKQKILMAPTLQLYHKVSSLTGQDSDFSSRYLTRNTIFFTRKHYSSAATIIRISLLVLYIITQYISQKTSRRRTILKLRSVLEGCKMDIVKAKLV
jgi:GT2 family glycosyltransferase